MRRALGLCAAIASALTFLSACATPATKAIEITQSDVTSARIQSAEHPKYSRVIALANGSAEIIDSLGLKSILVGRDIASTDSSLESIPIVTSGHQVIAEKIIALNPDLVIIDSSVGPSQAIDALKKAAINVRTINEAWAVGDIAKKVSEVASLIGAEKSGVSLADLISTSIKSSLPTLANKPRIAFLYLRGGSSIYLLGGKGSGADSLIHALGAIDVGSEISSTPFTTLTAETFASAKPDVILVMIKGLQSVGGVDGLIALPGIAQTPAGKNRRIIAVDDSLLLSFGPRTPDLLQHLATSINEVNK